MTEEIGFGFNGWGLLLLIISVFAWSVSHFLISLPKLDMTCRHVGFVSSVLIFIASGWKAGLIAIPVTIVCSFIGAAVVVLFRNSPKGKSFKTLRMIRIECLLVGNIGSITFGIILAYWLDSFSEMIVEGLVIAAFISIWEIISKDTSYKLFIEAARKHNKNLPVLWFFLMAFGLHTVIIVGTFYLASFFI